MIGILGGTFNPIHNGHLHVANHVLQPAELDYIKFIPTHITPHRTQPDVSSEDRAKMVELAICQNKSFSLDTIELNRAGPSYTIDTLKDLSKNKETLCLILGIDVFLTLDQWHQWQEILNYCHLIVVNRPSSALSSNPNIETYYQQHKADSAQALKQQASGLILMLDIPPCEISATEIRQKIKSGADVSELIPEKVAEIIEQKQLYQT